MKGLLTFALLCTIPFLAWEEAKNTATDLSLAKDWELVIFPSGGKELAEIFGQRQPELLFDELNKKVVGTSDCNHISGEYTRDGKTFQFSEKYDHDEDGITGL